MAADGKVRDEGDEASPEAEAAEYVLGTLDPRERRAAEWRMRRDPAFGSAVARWSEQLAALDSGLAPVPPPESVWRGIEAGLKGTAQPMTDPGHLRRSVTRWRFATAATALAAVLVAAVAMPRLLAPPPGPASYVAVLGGEGGAPAFVASVNTAEGTIRLRRVGSPPPPDRSFELWKVPATGPTVSLGVADSERELKPLDVALAPGERLAISVEPKGGSPTGQATGPVVYLGTLLPAE